MSMLRKTYKPFSTKEDPCPPLEEKTYETPPQLYLGFQEPGLEQFSPEEALVKGTLWTALYGPYDSPFGEPKEKEGKSK